MHQMMGLPTVLDRQGFRKAVVLLASVLVLAAIGRSEAMDVTSCGQFVRDGDTGVLVADLACTSSLGSSAVELGARATLELDGHTISGDGVYCPSGCTILGPGDITGAYAAVIGNGIRPMTLAGGLSIHDNVFGVVDGGSRLTLMDVDVSNNSENGLLVVARSVVGSNVVVNGNGA